MTKEEIWALLDKVPTPIVQIERDLGMPTTTLQKAMKGERVLPKKWALKLQEAFTVKPKEEVVELKVGDNKAWAKAIKEAGVKAKPLGTTRRPYMSDAIKKKLGIK